ncbi:MAG: alkaline phosphatase D family protein, partial [Bacteroidota bacterium]|nr:alkaline phosphatase D family protein [Bacteroidota bacterium]
VECVTSEPNRNLNLLTWRLEKEEGEFTMEVNTGLLSDSLPANGNNWIGFRLGTKGQFNDYRDDAIYGKGLNIGITTGGDLFIGEPAVKENGNAKSLIPYLKDEIKLIVNVNLVEGKYSLKLEAIDPETGKILAEIEETDLPEQNLYGSVALVSHITEMGRNNNIPSCWFNDWKASGTKLKNYPDQSFGPVLFSQYTLSRGVLKMTAQVPPIGNNDDKEVKLQIFKEDNWEIIGSSSVHPMSRTANFRVEDWDITKDFPYKLMFELKTGRQQFILFEYNGTIRKEPIDKEEIVVAGFTGNSDLGFPNNDLTEAIKFHDPDLLFFSGDQIYEGVGGYGVQRAPIDKAALDYLRKWYLYGWEYGDLLKDRPSVSIPDDHDVYHGNIWGAGGIATPPGLAGYNAQDAGGYKMPAEWVKMVERTQTSHLPDPYDPTPIAQGIGVYYTEMNYGGISFAIIEDRKFKSAPKPMLPDAEISNGWPQNRNWDATEKADLPEAILLGKRQLNFLEAWAADWSNKTWMKVVLSQTIFANVATLPKSEYHDAVVPGLRILEKGEYAPDDRPVSDFDSDGWPQSKRDMAIKTMRKAFAFHLAGDQHLGSTIQYGVDEWQDAGYAFCVPAISNIWPRRWYPSTPGENRKENSPKYTGDFTDGFGNMITVSAVSNPVFTGKKPSNLYDRATGYGIVRFNKNSRDITIECWPRFIDPSDANAAQYYDWPITINQMDNYKPEAAGWLPSIKVSGMENPVIKVYIEGKNELVYAIRINGNTFTPPVYEKGSYRIEIGDKGNFKIHKGIKPQKDKDLTNLEVKF